MVVCVSCDNFVVICGGWLGGFVMVGFYFLFFYKLELWWF